MKVYVLESGGGNDGDHRIEGVFSSDAKACEANQILDIAGTVTEMELDEFTVINREENWPHRHEVRKL